MSASITDYTFRHRLEQLNLAIASAANTDDADDGANGDKDEQGGITKGRKRIDRNPFLWSTQDRRSCRKNATLTIRYHEPNTTVLAGMW